MAETDKFAEMQAKLVSIEGKITQLKEQVAEQVTNVIQTSLASMKEVLSGEISQINGNVVTLGNTVTTAVTRESSETKRVVSEGFTEQRNKLATLPAMQSAVTQAIAACQGALTESIGNLKSYVETNFTTTNDGIDGLQQVVLAGNTEITTKCDGIKASADKAEETTDSLFVAYSKMVGEISRLATQAASDFAKDLLLANELRDAVENCEEIIDIFNDLKGTYKTIAEIAAKGLTIFTEEGSMRKVFNKIEAAKDVSFALSSLTNVFRAFKQEGRESRFDF